MRKLNRAIAAVPACLASYTHKQHNWKSVSFSDKEQIRASLQQMQGKRCAYCEGGLDSLGQHVEHFRPKGAYVDLTFVWANLYWACGQTDSCGHFKDAANSGPGKYNPDDLLDPCVDDPSNFLRFRSDGTVDVRVGLSQRDDFRARETLRVFNLHPQSGRLRKMREAAVAGYLADLEAASAWSDAERHSYAANEIAAAANKPFGTVVQHLLEILL